MKTLIILSVLFLAGCGTCTSHCIAGFGPGNKVFDMYGDHFDNMDPCQHKGKPEGYKLADFCFSNRGKTVKYVYDKNNNIVYTVR